MSPQIKSASVRLTTPLEFKFAGDQSQTGLFEGYASVFGLVDSYGELVVPKAFEATLTRHNMEGTLPAMLWSHDAREPIGKWLTVVEDDQGLWARGQLNLGSTRGQQALSHIRAKDVAGLSIGFIPKKTARNNDGSISLVQIDLLEISVVAMPANRRARIVNLKQATDLREFEEQLRSLSYSRADARRLAMRAWPKPGENPEIDFERISARLDEHAADRKSWR